MEHIIEYTGFRKKKIFNVHFPAYLSGRSRSIPCVRTAGRSSFCACRNCFVNVPKKDTAAI